MLNDILLRCGKCDRTVKLQWIDRECEDHMSRTTLQMKSTLQEVINQPIEIEPSKLESRAAMKVVSRILHQNKGSTFNLSTGGRVCNIFSTYNIIILTVQYFNYTAC